MSITSLDFVTVRNKNIYLPHYDKIMDHMICFWLFIFLESIAVLPETYFDKKDFKASLAGKVLLSHQDKNKVHIRKGDNIKYLSNLRENAEKSVDKVCAFVI